MTKSKDIDTLCAGAQRDGHRAACAGFARKENPHHPADSVRAAAWWRGWDDAYDNPAVPE